MINILNTNKFDLQYIQQIEKLHHDMKKNLLALKILSKNYEYKRLDKYLDELLDEIVHISPARYCKNILINGILCHQISSASSMGINVSCKVFIPEIIPISDKDISKVLMNLLNNAIWVCHKVKDSPFLDIYIHFDTPYLFIFCKNTAILYKKNKKKYGHIIINSIAKKYNGFTNYTFKAGVFTAEVALNCVNHV